MTLKQNEKRKSLPNFHLPLFLNTELKVNKLLVLHKTIIFTSTFTRKFRAYALGKR